MKESVKDASNNTNSKEVARVDQSVTEPVMSKDVFLRMGARNKEIPENRTGVTNVDNKEWSDGDIAEIKDAKNKVGIYPLTYKHISSVYKDKHNFEPENIIFQQCPSL